MKFITYSFKEDKQKNMQLALSDVQSDNLTGKTEPYRNVLGQRLPWEEPKYLETLKKDKEAKL